MFHNQAGLRFSVFLIKLVLKRERIFLVLIRTTHAKSSRKTSTRNRLSFQKRKQKESAGLWHSKRPLIVPKKWSPSLYERCMQHGTLHNAAIVNTLPNCTHANRMWLFTRAVFHSHKRNAAEKAAYELLMYRHAHAHRCMYNTDEWISCVHTKSIVHDTFPWCATSAQTGSSRKANTEGLEQARGGILQRRLRISPFVRSHVARL